MAQKPHCAKKTHRGSYQNDSSLQNLKQLVNIKEDWKRAVWSGQVARKPYFAEIHGESLKFNSSIPNLNQIANVS